MARKGKSLNNYTERELDLENDGVILRHTVVEGPVKPKVTDGAVFVASRARIGLMSMMPLLIGGLVWFYAQLMMGFVNKKDFFIKAVIKYAALGIDAVLFFVALSFFRAYANRRIEIDPNGVLLKDSETMTNISFRQVNISERKPRLGIKTLEFSTVRGVYTISSLIFPEYDAIHKMITERQALIHKIDSENTL